MLPLYLYPCHCCGLWVFRWFSFRSLCCWQIASGYQRELPHHFTNISERVEIVWHLLQVPDTAAVALVGMGGIGRMHFAFSGLASVGFSLTRFGMWLCGPCLMGFCFGVFTIYGHQLPAENA